MDDPRIRLLTLSGALDLTTERQLNADLSELLGDRSRQLVVDLRDVTFVDSTCLAILVHAHQQLERRGRALACIVENGPVRRLLDLTGLAGALPVYDTQEAAVAHVLESARSRVPT